MNNKTTSRLKTVLDMLSDPIDPVSDEENKRLEEERKRLGAEWAEKTLDMLIAYAHVELSFGELLCNKVVKNFGSDEKHSRLMRQLLNDARKGKSRGPNKRWNKSRYLVMLIHYEIRRELSGRHDALVWIAHKEKIGINGEQDCNIKKVEEKITKARKEIPDWRDHLPDFLKNIQTNR